MNANQGGSIQMSQGYEVLPPKTGKAYPILCEEWDFLKHQIGQMSDRPWLFHTVGSALVGAALSTLLAVLLGSPPPTNTTAVIVAWAVVAVTGICGSVCLFFAEQQRRVKQVQAEEIITQMELIEKRYAQAAG
jgi:hypothetical protein